MIKINYKSSIKMSRISKTYMTRVTVSCRDTMARNCSYRVGQNKCDRKPCSLSRNAPKHIIFDDQYLTTNM